MKLDERELMGLVENPAILAPRSARGCPEESVFRRITTGEAGGSQRRGLADHLVLCPDCAGEYRAAAALLPWSSEAAGLLAPPAGPSEGEARSAPAARWLAAAAAVIALVALAVVAHRRGAFDRGASEQRGAPEVSRAIEPPDRARLPAPPRRMEWAPVRGATSYELTIYDAESTPIWRSGAVEGTRIELPASLASRLLPGRAYLWRVVGRVGLETASSPVFEFSVSR